jgi:hypothetical protein
MYRPSRGGLGGGKDQELRSRCQAEGRWLITQDLEFSDARQLQPGTGAGLVLVLNQA